MIVWVLGLFLVVGTILAAMACRFWFVAFNLRVNGIRTKGTITRVDVRTMHMGMSHTDPTSWCFPTVSFTTKDGHNIEAESSSGFDSERSPKIKQGEQLAIIYRRDNPSVWSLDDWLSLYLAPTAMAISSAVVFLVAWLIHVGAR
jgi:hypothetical protein